MNDAQRFLAVYSAIQSVAALHSRGFAWLDVKPANFVAHGMSYVAIDLEGVAPLHDIVPADSMVSPL